MAKISRHKKQITSKQSKKIKPKKAKILSAQSAQPLSAKKPSPVQKNLKQKKPDLKNSVQKIEKTKKIIKLMTASATPPNSSVKTKKVSKHKTEAQRIKAVHILVEDHYESGKRLAWSFLNKWRVRIEEDEVTSITGAALCEAANRFNPNLGVNFKTFLFYYLRGMLLKEITKRVTDSKFRAPSFQHLQEANDDARGFALENYYQEENDETPESILDQKQRIDLCRQATAGLDALEQKVLEKFFGEDESVVDIAKSLGYCRCHISRVKSKALNLLTDKLSTLSPAFETDQDDAYSKDHLLVARRKYYRGVRGRRKTGDAIAA
jgi:RNA polymerase sigma factor (sigma-70 family)